MTPDPAGPAAGPPPSDPAREPAPGMARVVSNVRLTAEGRDEVRHVVLDLEGTGFRYLEGQSLGILVPSPGPAGTPPKLRLYSIASSRAGDDGRGRTVSLCVKRVVFIDEHGVEHRGQASNYLSDLEPGDEVAVAGPTGKALLLPEDSEAPLICVGTGTGIAPYRGFLRHLYEERPGGRRAPVLVYFGIKSAADAFYGEDFGRHAGRPGFRLRHAFSREQAAPDGSRLYVQHRLAEDLDEAWPLLDGGGHLYICGLKGMEAGVEEVLEAHARGLGIDWPAWREAFRRSGRLHVETY